MNCYIKVSLLLYDKMIFRYVWIILAEFDLNLSNSCRGTSAASEANVEAKAGTSGFFLTGNCATITR